MQDEDLRRTAEHLWKAWLNLNYAAGDLAAEGGDAAIRNEIGIQANELRSLAERMELIAASSHDAQALPRQRMRRPPAS